MGCIVVGHIIFDGMDFQTLTTLKLLELCYESVDEIGQINKQLVTEAALKYSSGSCLSHNKTISSNEYMLSVVATGQALYQICLL